MVACMRREGGACRGRKGRGLHEKLALSCSLCEKEEGSTCKSRASGGENVLLILKISIEGVFF